MLALHQAGALQQEIAERLQITRATVGRYLQAARFPERAPYPRLESKLDSYNAYLTERWAEGETNGRHLWQELQAQGFTCSVMTVMRWAQRQQELVPSPLTTRRGRKGQARANQPEHTLAPLRTRRLVWWLLRRPDTLSAERQALLARMEQANPAFGQLYRLTVQFTEMWRKRQPEQATCYAEWVPASYWLRGKRRDLSYLWQPRPGAMTHPVVDTGAHYSADRRRCSLPQSALLPATLESSKVSYR